MIYISNNIRIENSIVIDIYFSDKHLNLFHLNIKKIKTGTLDKENMKMLK